MIVGYNDEIIDIKHSKLGASPYLVMVTNSNNVKILNTKTHRLEYLIKGHTHIVLCADYWHPYVATAGKDNTLKLWKIN
jgi:WD40 repeat protein